jgi:hypothetical protein
MYSPTCKHQEKLNLLSSTIFPPQTLSSLSEQLHTEILLHIMDNLQKISNKPPHLPQYSGVGQVARMGRGEYSTGLKLKKKLNSMA